MLQISYQQHELHTHVSRLVVLSYLETRLAQYAISGLIHKVGRTEILESIAAHWRDDQIVNAWQMLIPIMVVHQPKV